MKLINKFLILGLLLIMTMSVTMAAEVSEKSSNDIITSSIETTQEATTENINETDTTSQYSSNINYNVDEVNNENIKGTEKISKTISIDSTNFDDYVTNGKFNENVSDGDTIDIAGKLDGSRFSVDIDKPLNIISSTGDAYYNSHTSKIGNTDDDYTNIFTVSNGGSGTNITGITFYNTQVRIENASNVKIDNINLLDIDQNIGQGVGAFTVREGSENITVTNSYFKTIGNSGHSNVVFAAAYNCLFENNTIEGDGDHGLIGNLLYLTTYNVKYANPATNINITIRNNDIRVYNVHTMATCWGLVLEGKGHRIENNHIDNPLYPVKAQYGDVDYGFETNITEIIFNNNTIVGGTAELTFPGIVANNTFNDGALLKQVFAYNNTFNTVTIQNNVKFENNMAKCITISGNNNTLNNNEVYSDEDYAITITGENNTLENNKLAGYLGRGDKVISNSTEIISINNSEDISRVFYINDDNWEKYFTFRSNPIYDFNKGIFKDGDVLIFNNINKTNIKLFDRNKVFAVTDTITLINNVNSINLQMQIIAINNTIYYFDTQTSLGAGVNCQILSVINSTLYKTHKEPLEIINSTIINYGNTIQYPKDNTYILDYYYGEISDLPDSTNIYVIDYSFKDLIFGKKINMDGLPLKGILNSNVTFEDGSKFSTITGITFNKKVIINDMNIIFTNCTFNGDVEVNNEYISFEGSVFNGNLTFNQANHTTLRNNIITLETPINITSSRLMEIENNTITTTSAETIVFADESNRNTVKNNILIANMLLGDDSVVGGDNIIEDNGASYNTSIEIVADDSLFKNDVSNVTVTVYNLLNNTPVDKGYVEVYLDGILQGIKPLVNGQLKLEVNTEKSSIGTVPLKVWYYDGIRYANNVTSINVEVVKSKVSISVDEFTAKFNEKAIVTAAFHNQRGSPVQDTNVTFTVGRSSYTAQTENGVATIEGNVTKEWFDAGKITISFPTTDAYYANTTTFTLNTSKDDVMVVPEVTRTGNNVDIKLSLTDSLGAVVTDGRINITTLDGQQLASGRVSNGVYSATIALPDGYTSDYLLAKYTGSYYYNDFERQVKLSLMLNSSVSIVTNSPVLGEDLEISGKLTDSNGAGISGVALEISVNGEKTSITTGAAGEYNVTVTPVLGENVITVAFAGTPDVYGTSETKTITIRDTNHDMNDVLNKLDELQEENDELQEQLAALQEQLAALQEQNNNTQTTLDNITQQNDELKEQNDALKDQLDNLTQANDDLAQQLEDTTNNLTQQNEALKDQLGNLTQANDDLAQQLEDTTNNLTQQNEALKDQLNSLLDLINQLNAPKDTVLTLDELEDAKYGDSITIKGALVDVGGNGVAGTVKLTINGGRATVTSDASGTFSYDYVASKMGVNNITATYQGTDKYNPSNTTATVTVVEQDTCIIFDVIESIKSGENAIITGQLVDANDNGIYGSIKLIINNGRATVKTDNNGFFKYEVTLSKVGINNVTASYLASAKYNACNATTTVEVTAMDTSIMLDYIAPAKSGETITITGKLVDANNNPVVGTIKLLINSGRATVKTDNDGVFSYETTLSKVGINNITVSYLGANRYAASSATTTVDITVMDTMLIFDKIVDAKKGETITVSGKLVDANDSPVVGTIKLLINGGRATVKTDENGVFTYDYTVSKVGINNITANYLGANRYAECTATTTATVNRAGTQITINSIGTVTQKTNVDITGQLCDENENGIYGTVKLLINNGRATVKTDSAGIFTYTYNATRAGDYTVTASYLESINYEACETTTVFTVEKA